MPEESPVPIEGAVAGFLTRVLDELLARIADDDAVRRALAELGITGPDADSVATFVAGQAGVVAALKNGVPELVLELAKPKPNLLSIAPHVQDLLEAAVSLTDGAPEVVLPGLPDAGTVMDALLAQAVEHAVQQASALGWSFAKSLHLVGPELPVFTVVSDFADSPTGFVWRRFKDLRRHLDITIHGVLTGPRTVSYVTVPLTAEDHVSEAVTAKVPDANVVLQRITLRLATDGYPKPDEVHKISLEVLGHDPGNGDAPGFAAVVLLSAPIAQPLSLSPRVTLHLDPFASEFGVAVTGWGEVVPIADGSPQLTLDPGLGAGFSFGEPGGVRLALTEPVLEPRVSVEDWGLRAGFGSFELTIPQDIAGDLLGLLLPRDGVRLKGRLLIVADAEGLHAEGGIGLRTTWPETLRLPGLFVRGLTTEVGVLDGGGFKLTAAGTVTVDLEVLTATIEGFGVSQPITLHPEGDGNLGLVALGDPTFEPPTGVGLSIDAGIVKGGGLLRITEREISGALELALKLGSVELAIRAVGVFESVDGRLSFVVVMSVEFSPAIEIFLGLTLNAVGGVFGINRTMDADGLRAIVRSGRMEDVMFPRDLAARAVEVIAAVKQVFPARPGQVVVGPMLKLGWGRPTSFVTAAVGVVFTFPDPVVIAVIGSVRVTLPVPEAPLIDMRADFAGLIDASTGEVSFDASLTNSRIATFDVTGDLALRAGPSGFLFTAGGFYPGFPVPAGLEAVRRLGISISPQPILSIRADAYFALTASTVQFGGGLLVVAELGPIGARGSLALDTLIRTSPKLHFTAQLTGSFRLSFEGEDLMGAKLDVLLEGPGRWHARARAEIEILFFSVSGTLELSWGDEAEETPPSVLVAEKVREALEKPPVWAHVLPAADGGLVTLREGGEGLHPLGKLRLTQTIAPLGVPLARFGRAAVADGGPVTVTVSADLATPTPAEELFAAAQYFDLTDDEKISKPPFVPHHAGYELGGQAWAPLADPLTVDVVYEESDGHERPPAGSRSLGALGEEFLAWSVVGAAGRSHAQQVPVARPLAGLKVTPTSYAVADAATGTAVAAAVTGLEGAFGASARVSADRVVMADYELAGLGG
ncbi:hypothetical protein DDE18_21040 [Nocardioides gansuensis]|uniref:DUF6603 domain-containing protein n=1 Tax=Nocardioides gansuensis TaxID=2138300 RepID=A0A2T8F5B4_9ACTN|nr:DUF6603 domain-containing protein [Nocardioides gansuensis]PVG80870.1 hypothetical protein DDE18_21040 [Nocardioides gansuensis]